MAQAKPKSGKGGKDKSSSDKIIDFNTDSKSGRLGRLDEHTLGYYRRVSDTLKDGFESQEERELMLTNVFSQLTEEALKVSRNQTVSTIVENLLKEATEEQLTAFMVAFSADWETACTDRFAGYVTQTLLHQIKPYIRDSTEDESPKALFLQLYGFLMGNLPVFMQDTYASHVIRVVAEVLGGCQVSEKVIRSKAARGHQQAKEKEKKTKPYTPPSDFKEYLKSLAKKLFSMKRLKDHAENYLSNPVMQTVLLVLSKSAPSLCSEMCQLLIANTDMFSPGVNNSLPSLLTHEVGSHLVEQLLAAAPEQLYTTLLQAHLSQHYAALALDRVGNYILQRLIVHTHNADQFESVVDALGDSLEDILAHNHIGIITRLAEACVKHGVKEHHLIKVLMKAFHCHDPVERQLKFVPLLASLTTYEVFYKVKERKSDSDSESSSDDDEEEAVQAPQLTHVNLHGSLLLQKLLVFTNPRPIVNSLLDLRPGELRTMACDKSGTHVLEAFLNSPTVGEKQRERLYTKLQGLYVELACDRGGSRVIDALWAKATMKQKELIAKEVSQQENKLRGDRFGHFVWRNLAIGHYLRRYKDWREIQSGSIKKRQLFEGILNPGQEPAAKKQKVNKQAQDNEANQMRLEDSDDEHSSANTKESKTEPLVEGKKSKKKRKKEIETSNEIDETAEKPKRKKKKKKHVESDNQSTTEKDFVNDAIENETTVETNQITKAKSKKKKKKQKKSE